MASSFREVLEVKKRVNKAIIKRDPSKNPIMIVAVGNSFLPVFLKAMTLSTSMTLSRPTKNCSKNSGRYDSEMTKRLFNGS